MFFYLPMHLDMYGMVNIFPLHCRRKEINTVNCNNVLLYQVVYLVLDLKHADFERCMITFIVPFTSIKYLGKHFSVFGIYCVNLYVVTNSDKHIVANLLSFER